MTTTAKQSAPLDELVQAFLLNPARRERRIRVAPDTKEELVIFDGLFADPKSARAFAVNSRFENYYSGTEHLVGKIPPTLALLPPVPHLEAFTRSVTGQSRGAFGHRLQLAPKRDQGSRLIHWDGREWLTLTYLSEGHDGEPGTQFFRHRETGIHYACAEAFAAASLFTRLPKPMLVQKIRESGFDATAWELLHTVEYQFNRCLFFPANLCHGNATFWGSTPADARLVHVMVIDALEYRIAD